MLAFNLQSPLHELVIIFLLNISLDLSHFLYHRCSFNLDAVIWFLFYQGGAEREQGLLQILTEMDGFKQSTSQVCTFFVLFFVKQSNAG